MYCLHSLLLALRPCSSVSFVCDVSKKARAHLAPCNRWARSYEMQSSRAQFLRVANTDLGMLVLEVVRYNWRHFPASAIFMSLASGPPTLRSCTNHCPESLSNALISSDGGAEQLVEVRGIASLHEAAKLFELHGFALHPTLSMPQFTPPPCMYKGLWL